MENQTSNKQKLQVEYPNSPFTFKKLENTNTTMSPQTLRLRLKQAVTMGKIKAVDSVRNVGKRGRAELVYSVV